MSYPHAPITEAVMDIRVHPRDGFDLAELRALASGLETRYPEVVETLKLSAQVNMGQKETTTEQSVIGYRFSAPEHARIFHAQLEGWSFSKLAPYESWEKFQAEAQELWEKYSEVARPSHRTRVAVRYINRLDLPLPIDDFTKYLRTVPEVAPDIPQGLAGFFMQLQVPFEKIRVALILNQAMVPPAREGVVSIVLDLDLFRTEDVPQDDHSMWKVFEELRRIKNQVFEACITDATRSLFL